ncbi:hypothetical protein, partial [Burkholderia cepacia]|uniref:hypothetical protein n=1 Tax=Burkholderia cepacia TaxID=292 RepID=UPI00196BAD8D
SQKHSLMPTRYCKWVTVSGVSRGCSIFLHSSFSFVMPRSSADGPNSWWLAGDTPPTQAKTTERVRVVPPYRWQTTEIGQFSTDPT